MLTVDEALRAVHERVHPLPPRRCRLADSLGCTLAEDVAADLDLPPFDKALVDGYAVRSSDLATERRRLTIGEEIPAGWTPTRALAPGEAAAIMTGAPLPPGADAVVMIEDTSRVGDDVLLDVKEIRPGQNRLGKGREMKAGDVVLKRGAVLTPARLGVLASVGRVEVDVVPHPRLTVVPTGDELVEPSQVPGPSQIRNSNAVMLAALASQCEAQARTLPIAADESVSLASTLAIGLEADVLVITGGVSAGNRDLVPATLERLGVTRVFHKIRLRPGKPLWFGIGPARADGPGALVFGLPGNPVSGIVGFLLFVRPALQALQARPIGGTSLARHPLGRRFAHSGDRPTYHPARLADSASGTTLETLDWAGSGDLRTVALADGFAVFPAGDRDFDAGEVVDFLPLG